MNTDEKVERLRTFKNKLTQHRKTRDSSSREWLNENVHWVRREVIEAGCHKTMTISPPPAVVGLIMRGIDPFDCMFEAPYLMSLVPTVCDMIDSTVGVLRNPPPVPTKQDEPIIEVQILESITKAEFVIVDLTKERPNVFFEAGFAHGIGKIPIYIARHGTPIHFDLKDYPVIMFRNMKELKEGIIKRLTALSIRGQRANQGEADGD